MTTGIIQGILGFLEAVWEDWVIPGLILVLYGVVTLGIPILCLLFIVIIVINTSCSPPSAHPQALLDCSICGETRLLSSYCVEHDDCSSARPDNYLCKTCRRLEHFGVQDGLGQ